ncbi:hypothetical protein [Streptomyces acidiscabies]|nr:hypothetical protein [Streptomyces acidiscabies]
MLIPRRLATGFVLVLAVLCASTATASAAELTSRTTVGVRADNSCIMM